MADSLRRLATQFPALVLTGARQAGKTSLLQAAFPHASFISLDLPSTAEQATQNPESLLDQLPEPLIIDEVQYAPSLFRHFKARIDARRHTMGRFLLTGSQKFNLMEQVSESLAGRVAVLELDSLSIHELQDHPSTADIKMGNYLWRGGYPELHRAPDLDAQAFFSSYVATYLERDLRQMINVGKLRNYERFVRSCAARNGQLLNLSELARDVGIAVSTASEWMSVLEASHLVTLLEPWFANIGKRMIRTPKLYFRDTGLLCFLLGYDSPAAVLRSHQIGSIWETFVLGEMMRARNVRATAAKVYFLRDAHGTEVDFVIAHNGKIRLAEAKWAEYPDASASRQIRKVHPWLGPTAADEHWIICGTQQNVRTVDDVPIRLINGFRFRDWFRIEDRVSTADRQPQA